ncbi:hypothetical protein [Flexivirga oryzae]|uniref:Uncharacterized protein n=1 Tax=Flexivirga oryzae TaxID=1794944 RepID=A0A839NGN0_9MICO|nr:hypothetical protein [Flexivirga oryzae]MBB2893821.1 hypothetical protein [Flexivirga oryzae]
MPGHNEVESQHEGDMLLPDGALLLHIGPSKTGSTAIQIAFDQVRDQLGQYGVAYSTTFRRVLKPGWAVIGWAPPGHPVPDIGYWSRYCERVANMGGLRVCASTEDFGQVQNADVARTIVRGLGGDRVHIVSAARAYHRLLPSYWQEMVRTNFDTRTYEEWLHDVLDAAPADGHGWAFTGSHNVTRTVPAWLSAVAPERYTLVVLGDEDRTLLPDVFEEMLGLPSGMLRVGTGANSSLSFNAVEVLRRLNEIRGQKDWRLDYYEQLTRQGYVRGALDAPRSSLDRAIPELPEWSIEPLARLSAARVEEVKDLGVRVVGNVDDLLLPPVSAADPEDLSPEQISVEAVTSALSKMMDVALTKKLVSRTGPTGGRGKAQSQPKPPTLADWTGEELIRELERRVKSRIGREAGRYSRRLRRR